MFRLWTTDKRDFFLYHKSLIRKFQTSFLPFLNSQNQNTISKGDFMVKNLLLIFNFKDLLYTNYNKSENTTSKGDFVLKTIDDGNTRQNYFKKR